MKWRSRYRRNLRRKVLGLLPAFEDFHSKGYEVLTVLVPVRAELLDPNTRLDLRQRGEVVNFVGEEARRLAAHMTLKRIPFPKPTPEETFARKASEADTEVLDGS